MINTRHPKLPLHPHLMGHPGDLVDWADEQQVWFRQKVYAKIALFLVFFVGVGLTLLLFTS